MALGIPAVISPVGMNKDLVQHGQNGFLASTDAAWIDSLSQLIESFELRQKVGRAGRKTVVERYSVDANKDHYLKYFKEVLNE